MRNFYMRLCATLLCLTFLMTFSSCTPPRITNATDNEAGSTTDTANTGASSSDSGRWFVFSVWNFNLTPMEELKNAAENALTNGFNAIRIHIPWFLVEQEPGLYNLEDFNKQLDYLVKDKDIKVVITVDFTRKTGEDKVISPDELQYDNNGVLCSGGAYFDKSMISFASDSAVKKANAFYRVLCENVIDRYKDNILLISPVFSQYAESEYWCSGNYDYSDNAKNDFNEFLKTKYLDISALNDITATSYSSFDEVSPPDNFGGSFGLLWYQYRHTALKSFIDSLCVTQKSVDSDVKLGLQFGSVFDEASALRGTLAFGDLMEKADVMWVDDGPKYDHNWSMDYIGSVLKPQGKQTANEIDGYYHIQNGNCTIEDYLNQGIQNFTHGADYLTVANWTVNQDFFDNAEIFREIGKFTQQDTQILPVPPESPVLEISLFELFTKRSSTNYMKQYNKHTDNGKTSCYIKITDDLINRVPAKTSLTFSFPASFSSTEQGQGCFTYHSYDPKSGALGAMEWSSQYNAWQGDAEFCLIGSGMMHPDKLDSAVVFTAPQDGSISFSFTAAVSDNANSDGVVMYVLHNGEVIYPGQLVTTDVLEAQVAVEVKKGDEITLICNKNKANSFDSTSVSIDISYN